MTSTVESLDRPVEPISMSARFYAGYLCMVSSIAQGEAEYQVRSLPDQLNIVVGRSLEELHLERQRIGVTRLRKLQTYLTDLVDPFGRDFAIESMGIDSQLIDQVKNPFVDQGVLSSVLDYHQDKRHSISPKVLSPYL